MAPSSTVTVPAVRRGAALLVSGLLLLVVVVAFGWALAGQWSEVVDALRDQSPWVLLGALALCLLAVWMSFLLWRGTLRALGSPLAVQPAARMFFVAQLGKYLPGSVWPVVVQMRLGKENGIPKQRTALAFLLTLGLSVLVGLLVGVAALPALVEAEGRGVLWGLLALPVLMALLVPRVLNQLLNRGLRLLRRPPLDEPFAGRDMARGVAWTLLFWVVFGLHVWLLAVGLGADPLGDAAGGDRRVRGGVLDRPAAGGAAGRCGCARGGAGRAARRRTDDVRGDRRGADLARPADGHRRAARPRHRPADAPAALTAARRER